MKYTKMCIICGEEFTTYRENQKTCSRKCMGEMLRGENNPNYNNRWSEEQRKHLSNYQKSIGHIISERVKKDWEDNEERKNKASLVMSETVKKYYKEHPEARNRVFSEKTRKLIGKKSAEKFTDEFKKRIRQVMVERGYWRPIEDWTPYEIYFKEADWIADMWDIVENDKLKEYGIFNTYNNPKGCVRDHMLGRREGFKLGIPPILLRHPMNCEILTHSENVKKALSEVDATKKVEDLFSDIQNYQDEWIEQEECLKAIEEFLNEKEKE